MDQTHPPAEISIDSKLVSALVREARPELASARIELVDEGWDNVTFRLGERYAVRLPRRESAVDLLRREQRWLPQLARGIELELPLPVHLGTPGPRFPWPWSIVRWVRGTTADTLPPRALDNRSAVAVARALRTLHRPAPEHAPRNPFRGVGLAERAEAVEPRLAAVRDPALERLWSDALATSVGDALGRPVWLHGDLHARNVVVRDGVVTGILDWGDLCAGDPATDLACAWTLFDEPARSAFWAAYSAGAEGGGGEAGDGSAPGTGVDDGVRARAAGWAVTFAALLTTSGEPRHVRMGEVIVRRLASETP